MLKGKFTFDLLKQHFRFTHTEMLNLKLSFQSLFLLGDFGTGPILVLHFESCSWVYPYIVIKLSPIPTVYFCNETKCAIWTMDYHDRSLVSLLTIGRAVLFTHRLLCFSYCLVSPEFLGET